jgi:hypothetical protein
MDWVHLYEDRLKSVAQLLQDASLSKVLAATLNKLQINVCHFRFSQRLPSALLFLFFGGGGSHTAYHGDSLPVLRRDAMTTFSWW